MIVFFILFLFLYFFIAIIAATVAVGIFGSPIAGILISGVGVIGLFFIIFLVEYTYQKWYFTGYFYDLTDHFIVIKKGVFTPREINIPYERIQDIYVDQDIFDRIFGLYDVHISSATITSGFEAHIDGVEKIAADGLRESLLKTVQEKIKRGNVPQQTVSSNGSSTNN
ncbi:MAG: PH domain-containing protein [Candidatus Magasanikbacteria bacterium]|nr:PH domain-containing protein [Candidatus Magasanikbacteria bacterium]